MTTPLLKVENLSKSYGDFRAVKEVSLSLNAGELLALIGPNGAGKTTCFNMLMGQIPPSSGTILFAGLDITRAPTREIWRLGVGRTFQIAAAFRSLTVAENVAVALTSVAKKSFQLFAAPSASTRQQSIALLEQVGLRQHASRACSELSYGDVKRLELAMALANGPQLLLMDEPTAGMAPSERESLMALTHDLVRKRGMAVLFTEHDMDAVFTHADRIVVLDRGRVIAQGTPAHVRENQNVRDVYLGSGATYT
jgi:ABC-type branched-subunit amino acid transport system ATPase component